MELAMGRLLLGLVLGFVLAPVVVLAWFRFGHPPVAVADAPLPKEKLITSVPLEQRIHREMIQSAPIADNEENLVAGAEVYRDQCAACHGFHGQPSTAGPHMFPAAPPLWEKHHNGDVVGVSDDPPGETYWKIANGIRLTGMPAYDKVLTPTQMWQVALLLADADKPLPPMALNYLRAPQPALTPPPVSPASSAKEP
jgi:mono/diheme cytochrome c family protein